METRGNIVAIPSQFSISNATFCRPQNYEELFNLRHASARNTVERIFGVFKREFHLFKTAPEYPMNMQAMFVPALSVVHNFVSTHDQDRENAFGANLATGSQATAGSSSTTNPGLGIEPRIITEGELGFNITAEEKRRATERRDTIAKSMWVDYQAELRRRGE